MFSPNIVFALLHPQGNKYGKMNNVPANLERLTRAAIREELGQLRAAIPMFGSWRIPELERIAARYAEILTGLVRVPPFDVLGKELLLSLKEIQEQVAETVETGDWRPFNKAVLVLQWDLDELARLM